MREVKRKVFPEGECFQLGVDVKMPRFKKASIAPLEQGLGHETQLQLGTRGNEEKTWADNGKVQGTEIEPCIGCAHRATLGTAQNR